MSLLNMTKEEAMEWARLEEGVQVPYGIRPKSYRIFLDLDGVVADFDLAFRTLFGMSANEADDKRILWKLLESHQEFYKDLPVMAGTDKLLEYFTANNLEVIVLTAIPRKETMPLATRNKREWVLNYLGDYEFRIGPYSRDKYIHCEKPTDILIDDRQSNVSAWNDAKGIGILYKSAKQTIKTLKSLGVGNVKE